MTNFDGAKSIVKGICRELEVILSGASFRSLGADDKYALLRLLEDIEGKFRDEWFDAQQSEVEKRA